MAVSIYFSETRDFKLIKEKVLAETDDYLVYVYADTKNIKIPRELIRDLPVFGNNIIWVDSADLDASQIVNHVVLTIGQFLNAEDPIRFIIASRTTKYEKAISLLISQKVAIEQIGAQVEKADKKPGRKRGRPKGSKNSKKDAAPVFTANPDIEVAPKRKRGRPRKVKVEEPVLLPKKKRGRPPKAKADETPSGAPKKRGRPRKEKKELKKTRKPREDKPITDESITDKLTLFKTDDSRVETIQKAIFSRRKIQRPKIDAKLSEIIQKELSTDEADALAIIDQLKATGMMDNSGKDGRLKYKD